MYHHYVWNLVSNQSLHRSAAVTQNILLDIMRDTFSSHCVSTSLWLKIVTPSIQARKIYVLRGLETEVRGLIRAVIRLCFA